MTPAIGCALLAAGASTRLGRPKQLLSFGGRPLVVHVLAQLRAAGGPCAVIIGSSAGEVRAAVAAEIDPSGGTGSASSAAPGRWPSCEVLENLDWHEGMAASIRCAVGWAERWRLDALLLAVCDQPLLTESHVRALAETHARTGATVASAYAGTCGVPAVFPASWFARLAGLEGDRGAGGLLRGNASVELVAWADGGVDLDTPEDVARFRG